MIDYGRIVGNEKPQAQKIDEFSVWINTDITEKIIPNEEDPEISYTMYEYNCVRYTKEEYIHLLSQQNALLAEDLTYTQLALVEVYESTLL